MSSFQTADPLRRYQPNVPKPFEGDDTPDLDAILKEVKKGCPCDENKRVFAGELQDWYDGESEKYLPFKPSEDALSWLTRPKRVSFITRKAVNKLTSHLYKPGPRARRVTADPDVDGWYARVCQDIKADALMKRVDQLVTLQGICAIGVFTTGDSSRPINYHLFPRSEFSYWAHPDDPRVPVALCTITKTRPDTTRFRLWTRYAYYTFYKGRDWGYQPGGWGTAKYDPTTSGPHPYGCLPFSVQTHEIPTTDLDTHGLGRPLTKINKALNIDMSNLALWVHLYAKPIPTAKGVTADWRPKMVEGGFLILPGRMATTDSSVVFPECEYLQPELDIGQVWNYIRGAANAALDEIDVPLTTSVQYDGGGSSRQASGLSVVAQDADLITYAKGRQPVFDNNETGLFRVICRVAASADARVRVSPAQLSAAAVDPQLRVIWPEPYIDMPSRDRDDGDSWELGIGITDPVEILMKRQGLTESEALEAFRAVQRRRGLAGRITVEELAKMANPAEDQEEGDDDAAPPSTSDPMGSFGPPDLGLDPPPANGVSPTVTVTTAVDPQMEIPAGPLILPATAGWGTWGTEA